MRCLKDLMNPRNNHSAQDHPPATNPLLFNKQPLAYKRGCEDDNEKAVATTPVPANQTNINAQDKDGNTLLHLACQAGNSLLALNLIAKCKANHNIQNNKGETPLMSAFNAGKIETVHLLTAALPEVVKKREIEENREKRFREELRHSMYL